MAARIGAMIGRRGAAVLLGVLAACAGVEVRRPGGAVERMGQQQFEAYAREVFFRQNRATDGIIAALDGGAQLTALEDAEEAMQAACAPLIELVQATVAHQSLPLDKQLEMPRAVPRCEAAVVAVEALLAARAPAPRR